MCRFHLVRGLLSIKSVQMGRAILLVERDVTWGQTLAKLLRRQGDRVRVAHTRSQALLEARRKPYDLAIVDLFVRGGGVELARELSRQVPRLYLSLGARLGRDELLEAALGFPVHRKAELPALLRGRGASSNGRGSAVRSPVFARLLPFSTETAPAPRARARRRVRPLR